MAKQRLPTAGQSEPKFKRGRTGSGNKKNDLIKRTNALDLATFHQSCLAEEWLTYQAQSPGLIIEQRATLQQQADEPCQEQTGTQNSAPATFKQAFSWMNEARDRCSSHPEVYQRLVDCLQSCQSKEKGLPDIHTEVAELLKDAPDLLPDFNQHFLPPSYRPKSNGVFHIIVKFAADLTPPEFDRCYTLIEQTSRPDYEASSWGWHPKRKKKEMREPTMRYLLVRSSSSTTQPSERPVEGFLSFMLTHDSEPPMPVLYVYEVHLVESLRKVGLGAHLMQIAEDVATRVGVRKVMLTCFESNGKARSFYEKRGYARDVCSPDDRRTRNKIIKIDYVIMSKRFGDAEPESVDDKV